MTGVTFSSRKRDTALTGVGITSSSSFFSALSFFLCFPFANKDKIYSSANESGGIALGRTEKVNKTSHRRKVLSNTPTLCIKKKDLHEGSPQRSVNLISPLSWLELEMCERHYGKYVRRCFSALINTEKYPNEKLL